MNRIPDTTITAIRNGKQAGQSLGQLSEQYHIAKSTVSYYCRDLFSHPRRKYQTELEVRKRVTEQAKRFTCRNCGSPIKSKNGLCGTCYQKSRPHNTPTHHKTLKSKTHKLYPCVNCKTNMVRKPNGLCLNCYQRLLAEKKAIRDKDKMQRQANHDEYIARKDATANELAKCSKSPTGAHFWSIDSQNIGVCKYCRHQKDMLTNISITKSDAPPIHKTKPKVETLSLNDRYHQAWCRITISLIPKGLPLEDALIVCNAARLNSHKCTIHEVKAMEREAMACPPIPGDIQLLLTTSKRESGKEKG